LHSNLLSVVKKTPTARGEPKGSGRQGKGGNNPSPKKPHNGGYEKHKRVLYISHIFFKHKHDLIEKFL